MIKSHAGNKTIYNMQEIQLSELLIIKSSCYFHDPNINLN